MRWPKARANGQGERAGFRDAHRAMENGVLANLEATRYALGRRTTSKLKSMAAKVHCILIWRT